MREAPAQMVQRSSPPGACTGRRWTVVCALGASDVAPVASTTWTAMKMPTAAAAATSRRRPTGGCNCRAPTTAPTNSATRYTQLERDPVSASA